MSKMLSYEEVDKKQLVDWIELCHDLFDEKKVKDSEHGALYSVFGRLGIYVKENEARIAALESRLREAEAGLKSTLQRLDQPKTYLDIPGIKEDIKNLLKRIAGGDTNKV